MALINCSECGKVVSSNATSCPNCGNPIIQDTDLFSSKSNNERIATDDERNGTIIYLRDICCLETIVNRLKSKVQELYTSIDNIRNNNYYKYYYHDDFYYLNQLHGANVCLGFFYDGDKYYFTEWKQQRSGIKCWDSVRLEKNTLLTDDMLEKLVKPTTKGFFNSLDKTSYWADKSYYLSPENSRKLFVSDFSDFKNIAPAEYVSNITKIKELSKTKQMIEDELNHAIKLLEKEYNLNIIPTKFRTMEAIYYIYDYFASSNERLSDVLFQLNLDEIKSRINIIIQNQETIIFNQSIQIAQNEALLAQNQKTLKLLTSIANDSAQTLKWTQIAANNAEVCAWIGAANYISNNL